MDNYGLLALSRQLNTVLASISMIKNSAPPTWEWAATPVVMPESKCPFCLKPVRSNAIWFLDGPNNYRLLGILDLAKTKVELVFPNHPHNNGGGYLCLGKNTDGVALLASTPNILDAPMGAKFIPRWLHIYWGHHCTPARNKLMSWGQIELVKEYDEL